MEHAQDETVPSFGSRTGACNFQPSAVNFCDDMGFPFKALVNGERSSVLTLARLTRTDPQPLLANLFVRQDRRTLRFRGNDLSPLARLHGVMQFCPSCLQEDMAAYDRRVHLAPYFRYVWSARPYMTCHRHSLPLHQTTVPRSDRGHDFHRQILPHLPNLQKLTEGSVHRPATDFEHYIYARMTKRGDQWIDTIGFTMAIRLCEILGSVASFGRWATHIEHTRNQWRTAGDAGYQIVRHGPDALQAFLSDLQTQEGRDSRDGARSDFGNFYLWLTETRDPDIEPIKDIVRQHLIDSTPVGPGDTILGRPVEKRIIHSIWTASKDVGLHPQTLRSYLATAGVVPADPSPFHNHVLFPLEPNAKLLDQLSRAMSLKSARTYINCERTVFPLLMKEGHVRPIVQGASINPIFDRV
ncbi:TniQ family protein [Pelagibacterium nitratireducens]|uniref:TniQ family protein n=1 Tax=Pelagibacterium nitratireducens TaxID=1046114 RepID=A0ABZ2IAV2_9HYPH